MGSLSSPAKKALLGKTKPYLFAFLIMLCSPLSRLYKGLYPLWGRQIPYTMMKFASFETIVEAIYGYMPGHKSDYGKGAQTGVSFAGGYLAGILCAIVSHPADVMVSKLNANRHAGEAFGAAMSRIYKDIGFPGLWNGLIIRIFMIGTLTSLRTFWLQHIIIPSIRPLTSRRMGYLRQLQSVHGPSDHGSCSSPEALIDSEHHMLRNLTRAGSRAETLMAVHPGDFWPIIAVVL